MTSASPTLPSRPVAAALDSPATAAATRAPRLSRWRQVQRIERTVLLGVGLVASLAAAQTSPPASPLAEPAPAPAVPAPAQPAATVPTASSGGAPTSPVLAKLVSLVEVDEPRRFVLTVSAVDLFAWMARFGGEFRIDDTKSVQGQLGIGVPGGQLGLLAGAQGRYYAWGTFDAGLFVGGELAHLRVASSGFTWLAALGGGKLELPLGLSVEAMLGLEGILTTGPLAGFVPPAGPLVRVAVGWTFGSVEPKATPAPAAPASGGSR